MLILSEIWAKNDFLKVISKTFAFYRTVDVYVDMGYSELGGHSITLTCCVGASKYKG